MLQDLLDRIAEGGIDLTIIPVSLPDTPEDPALDEAVKLMEQTINLKKVIELLTKTMTKNGYAAKADQIKTWWKDSTKSLFEHVDLVTNHGEGESEYEERERIAVFNHHARPIIKDLTARLGAMKDRQMIAVCEVDIDDLLT